MPPRATSSTSCTSPTREAVAGDGVAIDVELDVVAAHGALGEGARACRAPPLTTASTSEATRSSSARSGPAILMPTGVLMPVASMSMRVLMGMVQALFSPGNWIAAFIASVSSSGVRRRWAMTLPSASLMSTAGHSSSGLSMMVVSIMSMGAGSVAVSARPILPKTWCTSGKVWMILSVCWRICARLRGRDAGEGGRHVEQVAFVERRHELRADGSGKGRTCRL